jgi:hypothetical protein
MDSMMEQYKASKHYYSFSSLTNQLLDLTKGAALLDVQQEINKMINEIKNL